MVSSHQTLMVCKARAGGIWDSPCSIAYLMVGNAATIRYNVAEHRVLSVYTLRTAQDLSFVVLTAGLVISLVFLS